MAMREIPTATSIQLNKMSSSEHEALRMAITMLQAIAVGHSFVTIDYIQRLDALKQAFNNGK